MDVPIDNTLAEKWFSCEGIADWNYCVDGESEYWVAFDFREGRYGKKDLEKAKYWLDIAVSKGYKPHCEP